MDVVAILLLDLDGRLDDSAGLHLGDFRIANRQTAAAEAHHRVELMQLVDLGDDLLGGGAQLLGQRLDLLGHVLGREELMQRRIQITDGHRTAFQRLVHALEVRLLIRQQLGKSLAALLLGLGEDHLAHVGDTGRLEEHVLGAAQADAFRAVLHGHSRVVRVVRVGANAQLAGRVRPAHQGGEIAGNGSVNGRDRLGVHLAGGTVDAHPVALVEDDVADGRGLGFFIHAQRTAAGDAAGAHAAGNDSRVGGHAAAGGQDALRMRHALDILRRGLQTDENDLLAGLGSRGRLFSGEVHHAAGSARRGGQTHGDLLRLLQRDGVKLRVQQGVELLRLHLEDGLVGGNHALVDQIDSDLQRSGGGALAVAGLEHVELAALDGVFHVLHVAVVVFERLRDVHKLLVNLRHDLLERLDLLRGADAGDDVLALRVDQILAVELLLAGGRVAGERNAGAGGVAHVAKDHALDVDGGAPVGRDVVHAAVVDGARVIPGAEDGLDGLHELNLRVLRELDAHLLLVDLLEADDDFLHVLGIQVGVVLSALALLDLVQNALEEALRDLHNDVGEHLDETAVGVIGKALVLGQVGQTLDGHVVQAQVQDGIHHAGHGRARAGAHGNQERILQVAEFLAADLLGLGQSGVNLLDDILADGLAVLIVAGASLGGDGEALRHRKTDLGHLGKVRALAAQQVAHAGVAFLKQVHILRHAVCSSLKDS